MVFLVTTFSDKDMASLSIVGHRWEFQGITFFPELNICLSVTSTHWSILYPQHHRISFSLPHCNHHIFEANQPISLQLTPFQIKEYQFLRPFLLCNGFLVFYYTLGYPST